MLYFFPVDSDVSATYDSPENSTAPDTQGKLIGILYFIEHICCSVFKIWVPKADAKLPDFYPSSSPNF